MNSIYKTTMTWGLALGIVLGIMVIVPAMMSVYQLPKWVGFLTYVMMILGIVVGQLKHRNDDLNGYISYGRCFGTGMLVMLFSAIIYAFCYIMLVKVIDPDYISNTMEATAEALYQSGMAEDQVEMMMEASSKMMTPAVMLVSSILSFALFGAIFSLITSAFIKKEEPMFPNSIQEE